ncbi:MAG: GNAT family N-acetyltransferase [Lentisphaerae bacterium]|nr:GNAT family N-acetyltransferase [Lentisphaerota bacterium]
MSEITVRHATAAESGRIAAFNRAMALETEGLALEEQTVSSGVVALMGHPERGFYLVAEVDGAVAGCLLVTFEWSDWRNKMFWWIQSVYVKPEQRGHGVYSALYAKVRELAEQVGNVCGFRLYVHKDNATAQETYRNLGMEETAYIIYEELS